MAERTTLAFVDKTYVLTDGEGGSVVLDCNDGASYEFMLDSFTPRPAPQRQAISDSALLDGRTFRPGLEKLENLVLPFSVKVIGSNADDRRSKAVALMDAARDPNLHVAYAPKDSDILTFYDIIPAVEFDTDRYWSKAFQYANKAVIDFEVEASCGYGAKRSVDILKNEAPNASGEDWTAGALDDWTITTGGASAVTEEGATILDGSASIKMVRNAGDCAINTTGYIPIDTDHPWYFDAHAYSAAGIEITLAVDCYDDDSVLLDSIEYTGDTRGASSWDREVARLYKAGTVSNYYITPALWPEGTTKVQLRIQLNENGTAYFDKILFSNVRYVAGRTFDGAIGVCIPAGDDGIEGDLPALCDITVSNPFTSMPWKAALSGVSDDLRGMSFLDASNNWIVGADGRILYGDGLSWTPQVSGVTKDLYGVSAFDDENIWAVGEDGTILFSDDAGATWAAQTAPAEVNILDNPGFENFVDGGNYDNFTDWTEDFDSYVWHAANTSYERSGTYCLYVFSTTADGGRIYQSNMKALARECSYTASIYARNASGNPSSGYHRLRIVFYFYNAAQAYMTYKYAYSGYITSTTYSKKSGTLDSGDYPSGAAYFKVGYIFENVTDRGLVVDDAACIRNEDCLTGVSAVAADNVYACGRYGQIWKYGGVSWARKTTGLDDADNLNCIHALDATHIIAVGDTGVILTSADGSTWTARTSGVSANLHGVYSLDSTHAWAVGAGGVILFSADAGATWSSLSSGVAVDLHGVYAADSTHVWAIGGGGTLLFSDDGVSWAVHSSAVSDSLRAIDGVSTSNVWAAGENGALTHGIYSSGALNTTSIVVGQRDDAHDSFDPVVKTTDGDLAYSPYRYQGDYRTLDATETADFIYNLLAHAGSHFAISIGMSFSNTTSYDKGTIRKLLATAAGVDITTQYISDEIDLADPNTDWKETILLDPTFEDTYIPSHVVSDDALLSNIDQVVRMIAHASLAAVKLWVDHVAIIPTDRWIRVDEIDSNYLIIDSTMGVALDSIDGGPSTAMSHDPTDVIGTPRFRIDPAGTNITVIAINDVSDDMRLDLVNIEITYRPRTKMHL